MSETPKTDSQQYLDRDDCLVVSAHFARQLERELARLSERLLDESVELATAKARILELEHTIGGVI